jgi:predicted transcriptional regulator
MKSSGKQNTGKKIEPTKAELEILQVLWQYGPSTVRFVNDKLNEHTRTVQYTSTLKLMQIMNDKGMLKRDDTNMKHIYSSGARRTKNKKLFAGTFCELDV